MLCCYFTIISRGDTSERKVLERENDLKTYHSVLNEEMKKFHDCLRRIPLPLRPLLSGMVDDLEAKFEPGSTTLSSSSSRFLLYPPEGA